MQYLPHKKYFIPAMLNLDEMGGPPPPAILFGIASGHLYLMFETPITNFK